MAETIIERDGGLITVSFNRPEKKNALNATNWQDLDDVLREVSTSPDVRALLLTGEGGNFSSGADLGGGASGERKMSALTGREAQPLIHEMRHVGDIINRVHRLPIPTVAAVDGVAVGVSLGLALACDLIIASDRARFSEVFVKRGLSLDGGSSWTLPRQIGLRRAKRMAMFGEMIGAEEALSWGLVNEVVPADQLQAMGREWGHRLANGPTTSLSLIKRLLDGSGSLTFEEAVEEESRAQHVAYTTDDMREGVRAFIERRDPRFTGK
jgi:enoyl-CoA hydratase/carnithine racemase